MWIYSEARSEYLKLLERKEVYWKQRSKQFWLREGDQNTRFFHNLASGRKRNNKVARLKDKNDKWKEEARDLLEIITEYFLDLFKARATAGSLSEREKVPLVIEEKKFHL